MLHMHCLPFSYVCLISLPLASSHLLSPPLLLTLAHSSFNLHSVTCSLSCSHYDFLTYPFVHRYLIYTVLNKLLHDLQGVIGSSHCPPIYLRLQL
ncbi:hypothetical protein XELAEV_18038972mg [Xenopus laevis]|uniref:Secreted protein n=1 Tax=Xenopus laevis TaxID=8355 RepID=A0A974C7U0_XENLA|nr:hypothetical protein XELAEV_18038972mg [Xenopus laevis]